MPKGRHLLKRSIGQIEQFKQNVQLEVPATLGVTISGSKQVQVDNRDGYVWARIRGNLSELVQAYNSAVSPTYGLPVILVRSPVDKTRWIVKERDLGRYIDWGTTPYLPFHGATHSFDPSAPGGDPVWVYGKQIMPLAAIPSGSAGGPDVIIKQGVYYQDNTWLVAGNTGSPDLIPSYKPTDNTARMVLVYLDNIGNPQLLGSDTYFAVSITGTAAVMPYVPNLPGTDVIPIAAVRLVSGTSKITWSDIYDLRPFVIGDGFIATGTAGHTIQDDGVSLAQQTYLNFIGNGFVVYDNGGKTNVSGTAPSTVTTYPAWRIPYVGADGLLTTNQYWNVTGSAIQLGVSRFVKDSTSDPSDFTLILGTDPNSTIPLGIIGSYDTNSMPSVYTYCYNGSQTSPTPTLSGDDLFEIGSLGYDSTGEFRLSATITALADENFSASAFGASLYLAVVETGTSVFTNSLVIRARRSTFARDIVLLQTGTSAGVYFGDPDTNGSFRLTQANDVLQVQKRVAGVWTDVAGSSGHIIQDDGTPLTQRQKLNFLGTNFVVYDDSSNGATIVSGTAVGEVGPQGLPGPPGAGMIVYDNHAFVVTGSAIDFTDGLDVVASTGTTVYVANEWSITTDTFANRPAAGVSGRVFIPTDGLVLQRDNGVTWQSFGPMFSFTTPTLSEFSWVNQGSGTAEQRNEGVYLFEVPVGTAINQHMLVKAAPATPYTITTAFYIGNLPAINNRLIGPVWRQSSDGKIVVLRDHYSAGAFSLTVTKHPAPDGVGVDYAETTNFPKATGVIFLRLTDDGTNRSAKFSYDGITYMTLHTIGRTDYLTPDQVGVSFQSRNASWPLSSMWLTWKVE